MQGNQRRLAVNYNGELIEGLNHSITEPQEENSVLLNVIKEMCINLSYMCGLSLEG